MSDTANGLPPLPTFSPEEPVCGNCKLWQPHSVDHRGWVGPCRLQEERGLFPPSAPICDKFAPKGVATALPKVEEKRERAVRNVAPTIVRRTDSGETRHIGPAPEAALAKPSPRGNEVVDLGGELNMTRDELMQVFLEASGAAVVPLAPKWEGGVIQLLPGKSELQGKELPIDDL